MKEGVEGDSRGLDRENTGRGVQFDIELVSYWSLAAVLGAGKSWGSRTSGCELERDAHRRLRCWMHPCSSQKVNDQLQ